MNTCESRSVCLCFSHLEIGSERLTMKMSKEAQDGNPPSVLLE